MPKVGKELLNYISKLDAGEQADLLEAIKSRELLKQALRLDSLQRAFNKGKKLPAMRDIMQAVAEVRSEHAKSSARFWA